MTIESFNGSGPPLGMNATDTGGAGSRNQIGSELGYSAGTSISLNDASLRALVGLSGTISIRDFYGRSSRAVLTVVFASNTANASVYLNGLSGYRAGATTVNITVNSGVILYGNGGADIYNPNAAYSGLTLSGGASGDTVTLNNAGYIMGQGGAGGFAYFGRCTPGGSLVAAYPGSNGGAGLDYTALAITPDSITNTGWIVGGGGGGSGSTDTCRLGCSCCCNVQTFQEASGGGGGAGGGPGGYYNCEGSGGGGGAGGGAGYTGSDPPNVPRYPYNSGDYLTIAGGGGGRVVPPCQAQGGGTTFGGTYPTPIQVHANGGGAGGAGGTIQHVWAVSRFSYLIWYGRGGHGGSAGNRGFGVGEYNPGVVGNGGQLDVNRGGGGGGGYGASGGNGWCAYGPPCGQLHGVGGAGTNGGGAGGPAVRSNGSVPWSGGSGNIYGSVS